MKADPTTLVMAGAREAHGLVTALVARRRRVIASLPEPERMFGALPVPTHTGAFASAEAMAVWMQAQNVATVIDASHAFDDAVSQMAAAVCTRLSLRYLRLLRPAWVATVKDRWHHLASIREAARMMPQTARVFTNTGWATLPDYSDFRGRRLYMRQTHPVMTPPPFSFVEFVEGKPPFSQFQEEELFRRLGVSHLICRNVGGAASMSKLLAARRLALPVCMIDRAPLPDHLPVVETVAEALAWEANG